MNDFTAQPFGEYYLLERIAVGGMAEIFRAKTYGVGGFEKQLAIKRILPHHAQNEEFITMLIDEAKIAVALNHINIVQVFDLGKIDNDYFIAMEYVEGRDLRTVMRRSRELEIPLTVENAVYTILEICKGLDYAHRKTDKSGKSLGVVHRDISPQNILISFEGEVKIVDFGIAKAAGKVTETDTGILKGKFSYMSPEQAGGKKIDQRTDIFSAGLIMYELLRGEKLFRGKNHIEILEKIKATHIEPPFLPADIPSELEFILANALTNNKDDRYTYASDFQVELTRFLYSSALDFTTRNLAEFMRKLFQKEVEEERKNEPVDFALDEITRSHMLKGQSESLVSKTDLALEQTDPGESSLQRKNRTIIKKFQKILQQKDRVIKPKPPNAQTDKIPMHADIRTPPKKSTLLPMNPKEILEEQTERMSDEAEKQMEEEEDTGFLELDQRESIFPLIKRRFSEWVLAFHEKPTLVKIRSLVIFVAIFCVFIVIAAYLIQKPTPLPKQIEPPPLAQASPVATPKIKKPPPKPPPPKTFVTINFDPLKVHSKSARVTLQSKPSGARVYTNLDRYLGETPMHLTNIPAGTRLNLAFKLENHQIWDRVVNLEDQEEKNINISLIPLYGSVHVNTTPPVAKVFLNHQYIGQTPLIYNKIPPSMEVVLTIKKLGYEEYSHSFRLNPEETRVFRKALEEAVRSLHVNSSPRGAQIFLDGVSRGVTPMEFSHLTPGSKYLLVLRKPGYRPYVRKITLSAERGEQVMARLEPQSNRFGTLFLETDPPGATISVNDKVINARTPATLDTLRTDRVYSVKLKLHQYEPIEYRLRVDSTEITSRKAIMRRLKGRITVHSDPSNAGIYLNYHLIGETPLGYYSVNSGENYVLTVRKEGYVEDVRRFQLKPYQVEKFNFDLKKIG